MRKKKSRSLYIQIQKNRAKSALKRRKSHKKRLLRWKQGGVVITKRSASGKSNVKLQERVKAPSVFSVVDNTEEMLKFIKRLKEYRCSRKSIYLNSENITSLSNDAIVVLLSVISEFTQKKIQFYGSYPKNEVVCDKFEQSGFLNHVIGNVKEKNKNTDTTIYTESHKEVLADLTSKIVESATNTVFGHKEGSEYIQRIFIETMSNTHNHADETEGKLEWWLSTEHDKENNKVSFAFVDNGMGILKSVNKRAYNSGRWDILKSYFVGNQTILKDIFNGKLKSRTKLNYRGKGLPTIYKGYQLNYISNLCVITNNSKIVFDNDVVTKTKEEFSGTLIYFELNSNNII